MVMDDDGHGRDGDDDDDVHGRDRGLITWLMFAGS